MPGGYKKIQFDRYAYKLDKKGPFRSLFGQPLKKVKRWSKKDEEAGIIFEGDVSPEMRYLLDNYPYSEDPDKRHVELNFDIEVETENSLPDYRNAINEITAIAYHVKHSGKYTALIVDKGGRLKETKDVDEYGDNVHVIPFPNEEELLMYFLVDYKKINPTILTGWNIDNFDIPYLYNRIRKVFDQDVAYKLSPIDIVKFNVPRDRYFIAGVSCLDYMSLYKIMTPGERVSYSLDKISKYEIGEGKIEYQGTLQSLYETDIKKYIEYNIHDVRLVKKLDDKLSLIELAKGLVHKGRCPLEDVHYSSRYLDGAILTYIKKFKLIAPNKPKQEEKYDPDEEKFSGAYVKSPIPGKYNWIYDLDLTSMYPSIIRSLNISPETKVGSVESWKNESFVKKDDKTYVVNIQDEVKEMDADSIKELLNQLNLTISSNGIIYDNNNKGIIPEILEVWFNERVEMKDLMKKYGKLGDDEKYNYYKLRQSVQKVLLNSLYGVLGLPMFRFYDLDNAEAVTTTGVDLIRFSEKIVNHYYNTVLGTEDEDYIIYIDTDSLFVSAVPIIKHNYPDADYNDEEFMSTEILKVTSEIQKFVNGAYNYFADKFLAIKPDKHFFDMKQEVIAKSGFWTTKKRYALNVINKEGVKVNELDVKGLDVVRTSFPEKFRGFMSTLLTDILSDKDKELIDDDLLTLKSEMKNGDISEIARPTGIKHISKYLPDDDRAPFGPTVSGTPAHVKAAIAFNDFVKYNGLQNKYPPISDGEKIKWVYLKNNPYQIDALAFRDNDEDPPEVIDYINQYIDYNKIFEKEIVGKVQDFYDALNWGIIPTNKNKNFKKFF